MGPGWCNVLRIPIARAPDPAHGVQALLKCRKAAIRPAAFLAPREILHRTGGGSISALLCRCVSVYGPPPSAR
jgi:hypothetical protein